MISLVQEEKLAKDIQQIEQEMLKKDAFFEFSLPIQHKFPIGGGGYVRIAPWFFIKNHLKQYLKNNNIYFSIVPDKNYFISNGNIDI